MGNNGDDNKNVRHRSIDNLGWRAQSAIQPKRAVEIEGVGPASLLALQGQVEKVKSLARDGTLEEYKASRKESIIDRRNAGVDERNKRDRLTLKGGTGDRLYESQAALERKAEIYERLASGQVEDADEQYQVDFLMKNDRAVDTAGLAVEQSHGLISGDMMMERERRAWEQEIGTTLAAEETRDLDRDRRINVIEQLEVETRAGRQRAEVARQEKQDAATRKRELLKQELLRKKLALAKKNIK